MAYEVIFLLLLFFATLFIVMKSPQLTVKGFRTRLDHGIVPLAALGILILFGFLTVEILIESLIGTNNLVPWQIIVIFFAVAYVTLSIDATGILEYFSFKIVRSSKGSGIFLFFGLIIFTSLLTILTSNDIVILSMTPIVLYIGKHTKINPLVFLITVFFMANTWSMLFYIGNPTDIMLAQAFGFEFFEYTKLMFLPTLVAGISTTFLCFFFFRKEIPSKISLPAINPSDFIRSRGYAVIGLCLLLLMFALLLTSHLIGLEIWKITAFFAAIFLILNVYFGFKHETNQKTNNYQRSKTKHIAEHNKARPKVNEFSMVLHRYPYKIFPLIVFLFIMVHLFNLYGLIDLIAKGFDLLGGIFLGTILISFISAIVSNIIINQPMTLLFANALQSPFYLASEGVALSHGLSLIIGSNLGGNLTLFGALAGLMWRRILLNNGIHISFKEFVSYSFKIIPLVILITALTLALEIFFLY